MSQHNHIILADDDGLQLQKWLRREYPDVPLSRLHRLMRRKDIRVNGKRCTHDILLRNGDEVRVYIAQQHTKPQTPKHTQIPSFPPLPIIAQTDELIVIDKPAGIASQPGSGVAVGSSLIERVRAQFDSATIRLIHRLDRETSGVILLARDASTQRNMQRDENLETTKTYLTAVRGVPSPMSGSIKSRLAVHNEPHKSQSALTHYRTLSHSDGYALLEVIIPTGRYHQIRRHLASIEHPVLGDRIHGDFSLNRDLQRQAGLKRLFLHAAAYQIDDQVFRSPLPPELKNVLAALAIPLPYTVDSEA